ncbi:MAG: hypothetical protein WC843_05340 [Candidatus Gracilibacteria bacterium]|jgi:hypothetical protein
MSVEKIDANGRPEPEDDGLVTKNEGFVIELDKQPEQHDQLVPPAIKTPRVETRAAVERAAPPAFKRTIRFSPGEQVGSATLLKRPGLADLVLAGHDSRAAIDAAAQKIITAAEAKIKSLTFDWLRAVGPFIQTGNRTLANTPQPDQTHAELFDKLRELEHLPGALTTVKLFFEGLSTNKETLQKVLEIKELLKHLEEIEATIRNLESVMESCQQKSKEGTKIGRFIETRQQYSGPLQIPDQAIQKHRAGIHGSKAHSFTQVGMEASADKNDPDAALKDAVAAHHVCTEELTNLAIATDAKINALVGITPDSSAEK